MYDRVSDHSRQRIETKMEEMRDQQTKEAVQEIMEFNRTPSDLKGMIDKFVIGQEKGKKVISTAIAFHYRRLGKALKEAIVDNGDDIDVALRNTSTPTQPLPGETARGTEITYNEVMKQIIARDL